MNDVLLIHSYLRDKGSTYHKICIDSSCYGELSVLLIGTFTVTIFGVYKPSR